VLGVLGPDVDGDAAGLDCRDCDSLLHASKSAWVGSAARAVPRDANRPAATISAVTLLIRMVEPPHE
jgi:hypothetical protein